MHSVWDGPRRAKQGLASHQASLRGLQLRPILGQGKKQSLLSSPRSAVAHLFAQPLLLGLLGPRSQILSLPV